MKKYLYSAIYYLIFSPCFRGSLQRGRGLNLLSVICALLSVLSSCDTNLNQISPIPDAPVSYTLNILRDAPQLMTPGNSVVITEPNKQGQYIGYSGLLICYGLDDKYYAFDLCCPHEHRRDIRVEVDMIFAVCPECGSQFDVGFGSGFCNKGESKYPLKRYTVTRTGDYLRVTR